ncbi:MAG: glycosyltransferase [Lachnospiraceae bacterium]|nr:glycosyltransferase [Lachnospiraceae bacterium]
MKLSLIIPVYNGNLYIEKCLKNIIDKFNNRDELELIIINDGSTDNTWSILKKYDKYKNIILINNQNYGVSHSRNVGIDKAHGKYISFVDADDTLDDNWLNIIYSGLQSNKDIIYYSKFLGEKLEKKDILKYIIGYKNIYISGPYSKLFRLEFLKKNNIKFHEDIINGEDMIFNIEAFLQANYCSIESKSFYLYRYANGSATHSFNKNIISSDIRFHTILDSLLLEDNQFCDYYIMKKKEEFKIDAIRTIIDRISYLESYKEALSFFDFLNFEPYKSILETKKTDNMIETIVIGLCRKKMYFLLYFLFNIKHKIKRNKRKEYFAEV